MSTREQAEDGHGFDAQRIEIICTAELRGWEIVDWGVDPGVTSARLSGREGWSKAIGLVEVNRRDRTGCGSTPPR